MQTPQVQPPLTTQAPQVQPQATQVQPHAPLTTQAPQVQPHAPLTTQAAFMDTVRNKYVFLPDGCPDCYLRLLASGPSWSGPQFYIPGTTLICPCRDAVQKAAAQQLELLRTSDRLCHKCYIVAGLARQNALRQ
jgi:hypothetical protein